MTRSLAILVPLGVAILGTPAAQAHETRVAATASPVQVGLSVHWGAVAAAPVVIAPARPPAVVVSVPVWPAHPHGHRRALVPYPAYVHAPVHAYGHDRGHGYGHGYRHGHGYGHGYGYGHGHGHGHHHRDGTGPYRW